MARFEFSDGKSNKFWEIIMDENAFTVRFGKIGTEGQTQSKRFDTPEKAKAEHDKLVAEKLKNGYKPAGAIEAADQPARKPPTKSTPYKPAKIDKPIRRDIYVYNEATAFLITSRAQGGKGIEPGSAKWKKAVADGAMIPVELYQDDSFVIRVVVGAQLAAQEEEQWLGRLRWPLLVPDGKLAICGGSEFVEERYDARKLDKAGDVEDYILEMIKDYVRFLDIPKGDYLAALYTFITAPNGEPMMRRHPPESDVEKIGAFFRRTRPGAVFPDWLRSWVIAYPEDDPDHEKDWEGKEAPEKVEPKYVDFLLHLAPVPEGYAALEPRLDEGLFREAVERRMPALCPMGLEAVDLEGLPEQAAPEEYAPHDVFRIAGKHPLAPVEGGAVELPVNHVHHPYRLSWICHAHSVPQIHITLPTGSAYSAGDKQVEDVRFSMSADGLLDIGFSGGGSLLVFMKALEQVGAVIQDLPDGAMLELFTAAVFDEEPDMDPPRGLARYKGIVHGGRWSVSHTFPPLDSKTLSSALGLAGEVDEGQVTAFNEEEAERIIDQYQKTVGHLVKDNAIVRDGLKIGLQKANARLIHEIAEKAFIMRFAGHWTMKKSK
ncbi:MAG: WGR domain-containing protein [Nitrospinota bacterium]|nr:WGR domain-containing protein [Nitrospinota bacterium]